MDDDKSMLKMKNQQCPAVPCSQTLTLEKIGAVTQPIERSGATRPSGLAYQHAVHQPLGKAAAEEACGKVRTLPKLERRVTYL